MGAIHREAIAAGAEAIETDTFGANRVRLAPLGLADRTGILNRRAAQLAREARDVSGRDVLVAGSIGPVSSPLHGPSHLSERVAGASAVEQLDGLLEGGIDLVVIETGSDLGHVLAAVEAARRACDLPVLASLTFGEDLLVADGSSAADAAAALHAAGVDALGVNCGSGPIAGIEVLEQMREAAAGTPLLIMPNAGLPGRVGGSLVWAATAAYFADEVPRFLAAGAVIIGGCCGTTPDHVAAMRKALDHEPAGRATSATAGGAAADAAPIGAHDSRAVTAMAADHRAAPTIGPRRAGEESGAGEGAPPPTGLAAALAAGRFVVSVESTHRAPCASSARCDRPRSSAMPARTSSTSATAPWPACAWAPSPSASPSSASWAWRRSSTSPPATGT